MRQAPSTIRENCTRLNYFSLKGVIVFICLLLLSLELYQLWMQWITKIVQQISAIWEKCIYSCLALGKNILEAQPGGGIAVRSGTSFAATSIVSGMVALLLSLQQQRGESPIDVGQTLVENKIILSTKTQVLQNFNEVLIGN